MVETGTFPEGIIVDGVSYCDFTLVEKTFRNALEIAHDQTIDHKKINDGVYYDACVFAKRLQVEGVEKITPEQVLELSGPDGDELIRASVELDDRRKAFRDAAQAAEKKTGSAA